MAFALLCRVAALCAAPRDWTAQVIDLAEHPEIQFVDDYAVTALKDAWDFDEGDLEGLSRWTGMTAPEVVAGHLRFETRGHARLVWGDFDLDRPEAGELDIGAAWWRQAWPWVVLIKLRQSVAQSTWKLEAAYREHGNRQVISQTDTLKGTDPAVLQFDMGATQQPFFALSLSSASPRNRVEIDWIRIVRPSIKKVFVTEFDLPLPPLAGDLYFGASGRTGVYLNGQSLGDFGARHPFSRRLNHLDVKTRLLAGRNTLCVEMESFTAHSSLGRPGQSFFFLEGGVIVGGGHLIPISSGKTWKGFSSADGCKDRRDQRAEKRVRELGGVRSTWPMLQGLTSRDRLADPPYIGRLRLDFAGRTHPFFFDSEDTAIGVNVLGDTEPYRVGIRYELREWRDSRDMKAALVRQGTLMTTERNINLGRLAAGAYNLVVEALEGDKVTSRKEQELIVTGVIPQRLMRGASAIDGLELKQVDVKRLDSLPDDNLLCGRAEGGANRLLGSLGMQKTIAGGIELPQGRLSWCSVKLAVQQLHVPHMIEIRYPTDRRQNAIFVLAENSRFENLHNVHPGEGIVRLSTGVIADGVSGRGVAHYIYWPNRTNPTLTIVNAGRGILDAPAASEIRVYEIRDGLPAWTPSGRVHNDKLIGPFVERVDRTTARLFYSGPLEAKFSRDQIDGYYPGYYAAWYGTISNLVQYLKFSGQNTYYAGIYMYYGGWFPSQEFRGDAESGADFLQAGWTGGAIDLLAKMFEKNDLSLVLGVQFIGSRRLIEADVVSDKSVREGTQTIRFVNAEGRQVRGFQGHGYNFMEPVVRDEMLKLADAIGKQFAQYPAVKGISWLRLPEFPSVSGSTGVGSPLDTGYDDRTMRQYKQETGSLLPAWGGDSERFGKRKKWLIEHERERWLAWRCRKVWELDNDIQSTLNRYRHDLLFWHIAYRPLPSMLGAWGRKEVTLRDVYRYSGIDPVLYANRANSPRIMAVVDVGVREKLERNGNHRDLAEYGNKFYHSGEFIELFKDADMFAHVGFMVENLLTAGSDWPWRRLRIVGYAVPDNAAGFFSVLVPVSRSTAPSSIAIGWSDVGHFSGEVADTRAFIQAGQLVQ